MIYHVIATRHSGYIVKWPTPADGGMNTAFYQHEKFKFIDDLDGEM